MHSLRFLIELDFGAEVSQAFRRVKRVSMLTLLPKYRHLPWDGAARVQHFDDGSRLNSHDPCGG